MSKIKLFVELEYYDVCHGTAADEIEWFYNYILKGDGLILHSNEIGDSIGTVKVSQINPPEYCGLCNSKRSDCCCS